MKIKNSKVQTCPNMCTDMSFIYENFRKILTTVSGRKL